MRTQQVESGISAMSEVRLLPDRLAVTLLTSRTEQAVVGVVSRVTCDAGLAELLLLEGAVVAGHACSFGVSSGQWEVGFASVVERAACAPAESRVAGVTGHSESPAVCVVQAMTSDAGVGRALVAFRRVAHRAPHGSMAALQREACRGVVEATGAPARLAVTLRTIRSHATLVAIVLLMTGEALGRCIAERAIGSMTCVTRKGRVSALQGMVGELVLESLAIELHELCVSSAMLGVAGSAGGACRSGVKSVKSAVLGNVFCDLFVALRAELGFRSLTEGLVTLRAIGFVLGVGLCERSRHDELLEVDGCGRSREHREQDRSCERGSDSEHDPAQ